MASMRFSHADRISRLQRNPDRIRNICVMAHVDHGKTTISDSLIASNGIISQRMSGKLRYLDSRKDEQERGITMKSSAIALSYNQGDAEFLINLIDSPGHVDFTGEVSSAIQLCDGALIVVDVVEGVCAQTKVSIRQAWSSGIQMVLILNKMDRLIGEMKLIPLDAYYRLQQIMEQVNAVVADLFTSDILQRSDQINMALDKIDGEQNLNHKQVYNWNSGLEETDDSNLYFSPDQGNVVFTSGVDCWGFRIDHFAEMYASKLDVKESILLKTLWGDFYMDSKHKRIMTGAQEKAKKPLFVQLILENIWSVYDTLMVKRDRAMTEKIIKALNVKIQARDMRSTDPRLQLQAILSQWLPLASSIFDVVCEKLPSPVRIQAERAEKLMCTKAQRFHALPAETQKLKSAFCDCSSDADAQVIVFVSKMFAVDKESLPQQKPRQFSDEELAEKREIVKQRLLDKAAKLTLDDHQHGAVDSDFINANCNMELSKEQNQEEDQIFVAFARIFSGTIRKGQKLYVLGPKHDPAVALEKAALGHMVDQNLKIDSLNPEEHVTVATVSELYLLLGRDLEELEEVPAGCIFGIGKLESHIIKSATLSSTLACPPFTDLAVHSLPIMRVAVEPAHPGDLPRLIRGLKLLNQADANVEVLIQESGELVIITSGEVHLQRCLDDLKERFAKVDINSSTPIVPFRETIVEPPKMDMVNEAIEGSETYVKNGEITKKHSGVIDMTGLSRTSTIRIRAAPLPDKVVALLDEYADLIKIYDECARSLRKSAGAIDGPVAGDTVLTDNAVKAMEFLKRKLDAAFQEAGADWSGETVDQIWAFGPRHYGPNVLLSRTQQCGCHSYWSATSSSSEYDSSFVTGFQLATNSGPLCREPMRGVCFIVEEYGFPTGDPLDAESESSEARLQCGPFSGQLMSAVHEACREAFQDQPQRLMAAMYCCNILVTAEVLGKMYAVLNRRSGRVLHADLHEGSAMFQVTAVLPVIESFDFASEIRRQTSGLAMPQLTFSHWETIETDPFWVPTTKEEYLLFGEKADSENRARKYMNLVRKRKGLAVDEKIIEHAEKQRTLAKKK